MPRVLAVLGEPAALGFALTGMEVLRVRDPAAALLASNRPIFIPIRIELAWVPEGQALEDDYVAKLIRHAVGYQLNIQL
jgi:hypothetical protein